MRLDYSENLGKNINPASILRKSTSGRHRPVSYPDGPMTGRWRPDIDLRRMLTGKRIANSDMANYPDWILYQ